MSDVADPPEVPEDDEPEVQPLPDADPADDGADANGD